ncbi:hypothetical protein ACIHFC_11560 [Streptomyces sp. NPDC052013]|uniref:hypothetical protein n=1 Tax=Streptomyces sp. NPDC052013 TaxID=3365679 RepID=UPI0037CD0109
MSAKKQGQSSASLKEAGFAAAIALPLSLLGGWVAYGYSGSVGVAAVVTGVGVAIGLAVFLLIARSGT